MSNLNVKLLAAITTALNVFEFEELKTAVTSSLISVDWDEIKRKIKGQNLKYTKNIFVKSTIEALKEDDNLTLKSLQIQLFKTMLLGRTFHSNRYQWNANRMSRDMQIEEMSLDVLHNKIKTACRKCKVAGTFVSLKHHNNLYWMVLALEHVAPSKQLKRRGPPTLPYKTPYFFVYKPETRLLLSSKKACPVVISEILTEAFSFQNLHSVALFGYHVESLFRMLTDKRRFNADYEDTYEEDVPVLETSQGFDFIGHEKRAKYATDVFTENPPTLHTLTIKSDKATWQGISEIPEMEGERFETSITFSGPDVFEMMKKMTEIGMIKTPYPPYMHNLLTSGRNMMTLTDAD